MDSETLVTTIRNDLILARKQRDVHKSQALLSLVNSTDNASAVDTLSHPNTTEVARRLLDVDDVKAIINSEINEMQEAMAIYQDINSEKTHELASKIATLKIYI